MRARLTLLSLLTVALVVAQARPASATLATEIKLPAMTEHADLVVRGSVVKRRTSRENGHLYTQVTIHITEVHKGEAPKSGLVVIRTIGGQSGLMIERIDGEPEYLLGQDVLVFLANDGGFYHRTMAMAQGKFDIVRDPISRVEHITRDLSGLAFVTFDPNGALTILPEDTAQMVPASYHELVTTIRRQVARTAMMHASAAQAVVIARNQLAIEKSSPEGVR